MGSGAAEASGAGVVTPLLATLLSAGALLAVEEGAALIGTATEPWAVALSADRFKVAV